jgi:cytochrome c oxidase cbb3-type subunit 4
MDVNDLRAATTVISFAVFIGIIVWAFSKRNKKDFEEAAQLPLDQD